MGQGPQAEAAGGWVVLDPMAHEEGGLPANAQSPHSTQYSTFLSKYLESEKKMKRTSAEHCPGWKSLDLFPEIYGPPHSTSLLSHGKVTSPRSFPL